MSVPLHPLTSKAQNVSICSTKHKAEGWILRSIVPVQDKQRHKWICVHSRQGDRRTFDKTGTNIVRALQNRQPPVSNFSSQQSESSWKWSPKHSVWAYKTQPHLIFATPVPLAMIWTDGSTASAKSMRQYMPNWRHYPKISGNITRATGAKQNLVVDPAGGSFANPIRVWTRYTDYCI